MRVYDAGGQEIQDGDTFQPEGDQLAVRLPADLPDGGLTATFRAISADSHPVSGGFSFVVGEGGGGAQAVDRLLQGTNSGPVTATALGVARALQYTAITLAVGTLLFLALCAPAAAREAIAPRVSGALAVAAVTGLVASDRRPAAARRAGGGRTRLVLRALARHPIRRRRGCWQAAAGSCSSLLRRSGWATLPAGALCAVPAAGGHASVEGPLMLGANLVHVVIHRGLDRRPRRTDLRLPARHPGPAGPRGAAQARRRGRSRGWRPSSSPSCWARASCSRSSS